MSMAGVAFDSHHWQYPLQLFDTHSQKRRAFIAEDAVEVRESLTLLLEHEGFTVVGTATTEYEAIDWLLQHEGNWELAIIDLLLRDGSGFNVLRHFTRSRHPGKVLVYSGYVTDVVRTQRVKLGATAVISKTDVKQLQQLLDTFRPNDDSSHRG